MFGPTFLKSGRGCRGQSPRIRQPLNFNFATRKNKNCRRMARQSLNLYLLHSFECFLKVLDNIVDIFRTYGKSYSIGSDTLIEKFFLIKLRMCC